MPRIDFRTIVERLPLVVYVDEMDDQSSPLYISPQIYRLLGYTQDEWLADPQLFPSRIHPDDRARVLAEIATRNRHRASVPESDYRLVARDGRIVWVETTRSWSTAPRTATCRTSPCTSATASGSSSSWASSRSRPTRRRRTTSSPTPPASSRRSSEATSTSPTPSGATKAASTSATRPTGEARVLGRGRLEHRLSRAARGTGSRSSSRTSTTRPWLDPIRDRLVERNVASFVDVPLLRHGRLDGVLWFNSSQPRTWGEHEVSLLVDVAGQLAVVLANARAREQRLRDERASAAATRSSRRSAARRAAALRRAELARRGAVLLQELGEATAASRCVSVRDAAASTTAAAREPALRVGRAPASRRSSQNAVTQAMCFEEVGPRPLRRHRATATRSPLPTCRDLPAEPSAPSSSRRRSARS